MNKNQLIEWVSDQTGVTKTDIGTIFEIILKGMYKGIINDGKLTISNFGTFRLTKQLEKNVRIPDTKEIIKIPEKNVVRFVMSKKMKGKIND